MKRLVVLFICLISLPAFADLSGVGNVTISKKIAIPRKILEQVISADSELKPYLDAMLKKYDSHYQMYGRYEFSVKDVQDICSAAIDILKTNDDCLRRVLYPIKEKMGKVTLKDVCNVKGTVVGGTPYCIDDVFVEKKGDNTNPYHQDVNVALATALGFAIEYGKANGHDLWCGAQPVDNAILCTDYDDKDYKFYSFKFAGVNNTSGGTIQNNVGRGICALHNAKYEYRGAPTCIMNCAVGTAARDTISKFGMDIISPDTTTDSCTMKLSELKDKDLRTYPGYEYMTTAFANVQTVLDGSLSKIIKQYVRFQGLPIQSFECEYSSRGYYPYSVSDEYTPNPSYGIGWNAPAENLASDVYGANDNEKIYGSTDSEPIDDVLRCKINGYDVDFVFDDLYESKEYQQKVGKDALGCISMGGNYRADTTCRGLTREVCLSTAVQEAITGGTYWNKEAQVCMLNSAESVRDFRNAIDIGTGVVIGLAIGWYAGPVIALVSIAGDLAINSAFIALEDYAIKNPNSRATAFLNDVEKCDIMPNQAACDNEQKQCAYEIFKNHFARLQEVIADLNNDQIKEVSELMDTVSNCLSDGELIKSISESDVLMKDKVIEQSAMFIMIGGVLWSPETMVTKLAQNFPKLGKIFGRMKVLGYVDEGANGVRYLQIDGLNDAEINQINMHLRNESFSVQRSVRNGKNVILFSKNSAGLGGKLKVSTLDDIVGRYNKKYVFRAGAKNSLGSDYYRIVVNDNDDVSGLINDLQKNGFYVSSNKAVGVGDVYFIAVSKENVFGAWDNNPNNWLKFGKPRAAGLGGKLKVSTLDDILGRYNKKSVFRAGADNSLGSDYYRISVNDNDDVFGLINDLQKNGFFVSANQTIYGEKFIAVSKENVFQSWSNSPTNWLKGYRGGIVRGRGVFDNIYNDMPEDVLKRKLEYIYDVERKGGSNLDIVNAMKQVGAFDEVAAKRLAQDIADETINRIKADPILVEQGKNWRILSKTEKEEFVINVHDLVTRERRKRAGNTEITFKIKNPDTYGFHAEPYGKDPRKFGYNLDAYDSAADALETIIHENTHSFQSVYKSSIPKQLVDLSNKHYISPKVDYDGYRNVLIEVEARYVAEQSVPIIARALRW